MRRPNARPPPSLPDSNSGDMDTLRVPVRPISARSTNLFSRNPKHATPARSNLLIFATVAITVAAVCYLFAIARGNRSLTRRRFSIVIDGGSTGTRMHVFEYSIENGAPVFDFGKDETSALKVNPGLSAYAEDPERAGGSLVELLDFGKSKVPKLHWGDTEVRLMATAGMRMLDVGVQEKILESCRRILRSSGFKFRDHWASVITGSDEGMYAWVVANYALGTLGGDPLQTTGIIELGGASAQVTFIPSEPVPAEYSHSLRYGNTTYNLYSHSFLHFGQNVAFESLRDAFRNSELNLSTESKFIDPCAPKGYDLLGEVLNLSPENLSRRKSDVLLQAGGNFSECRSAALTLIQRGKEKCSYQWCYLGPAFTPKLHGKFLATENFYYTSKFFGLTSTATLSDLVVAGHQFCEEDWSRLAAKYHSFDKDDLMHYCFSSAYIVAILHDSLGVALDDNRIGFTNQVGDIPLDWAFGAFILQSTSELQHSDWIGSIISDDSPTLLSLVFVCGILMFTAWSILKWKKPQLKTIYDLEKGRYIVTRINRS